MDAIDSSFASHLRHRTLRAKGVLRMTHAPLFRIRVKATFPPDTRGLLLRTTLDRLREWRRDSRFARTEAGVSTPCAEGMGSRLRRARWRGFSAPAPGI